MHNRTTVWRKLCDTNETPVLILGGGVDGIGLYRDLAFQGVEAVLVDKADFTAGASSGSSRMIHGGLRYLENRELSLVWEAVHERNLLLENAPHYVTPLKTTIPLFAWFRGMIRSSLHFLGLPVAPRGRGIIMVKLGLMIYDLFTGWKRRIPKHFFTMRKKSLEAVPGLHPDIKATATYWDAKVSQIERLCIQMLKEAEELCAGSCALNYVQARKEDEQAVMLTDTATGESCTIRPKVVVNATGAWVDRANRTLGIESSFMGGTKGSHLVIKHQKLYDALGDRMIFYEHTDGRVCIMFRFMDKIIMGSTDLRINDPDDANCTEDETAYMIETLKSVFPDIEIAPEEIVFSFCGVRPLASAEDSVTGTISRAHKIQVSEPDESRAFPVYSMVGGKLSTFRSFAEQTCDAVLEHLNLQRTMSTEHCRIGGGKDFPEDEEVRAQWITDACEKYQVPRERMETLLERYGTEALEFAAFESGKPPEPLQNKPDYTRYEIEYIIENELVEHLTDLTCRRSLLAMLGDAREALLKELAEIAAPLLCWDEKRREEEVQAAKPTHPVNASGTQSD